MLEKIAKSVKCKNVKCHWMKVHISAFPAYINYKFVSDLFQMVRSLSEYFWLFLFPPSQHPLLVKRYLLEGSTIGGIGTPTVRDGNEYHHEHHNPKSSDGKSQQQHRPSWEQQQSSQHEQPKNNLPEEHK